MIQLALLGIIVLGAALGWIYYNQSVKKQSAGVKRDSEGKVIYLFGEENKDGNDNNDNKEESKVKNRDEEVSKTKNVGKEEFKTKNEDEDK